MAYVKVTYGRVRQIFDNNVCTGQEFVASDRVEHENVDGVSIRKPIGASGWNHPFDMEQPQPQPQPQPQSEKTFVLRTVCNGRTRYLWIGLDSNGWTEYLGEATFFTREVAQGMLSIFNYYDKIWACVKVTTIEKEDD